jgi:catechol 2,3-dioxygenase-like lactoylglutathione lyase family enzyme
MATAILNPSEAVVASETQFHVTLCVGDLARSVRFYECLLGCAPTMQHGNYARFDLQKPALVLVLYATSRPPGGALSHVGLRVGTSAELVEIQQRLEAAGIATQCQEGVECCYARQTKFWATDPDGVMWELYVLEEDLDHSGFEDPPMSKTQPAAQAVWIHRLTDPLPDQIPFADGSLDELRFEGSFNVPLSDERRTALLAEAMRVLRSGGRVVVHGLLGDRPLQGEPNLPGLASLVRHVPVESEIQALLAAAGFEGIFYETLSDVNCISVAGVDLRHGLLIGYRPAPAESPRDHFVLYRGPMSQVQDEQGIVYSRGERVAVTAATAQQIRGGPAAEQFVFFSPPAADPLLPLAKGCCC